MRKLPPNAQPNPILNSNYWISRQGKDIVFHHIEQDIDFIFKNGRFTKVLTPPLSELPENVQNDIQEMKKQYPVMDIRQNRGTKMEVNNVSQKKRYKDCYNHSDNVPVDHASYKQDVSNYYNNRTPNKGSRNY